jgi:hypothetical protein
MKKETKIKALTKPRTLLSLIHSEGRLNTSDQSLVRDIRIAYLRESKSLETISKEYNIPIDKLKYMSSIYGWKEEKIAIDQERYRKICKLADSKGLDINARTDRMLHSIEDIADSLIEKHNAAIASGDNDLMAINCLSVQQLSALTKLLTASHSQRRLVRGEATQKTSKVVELSGQSDILQKIGAALSDRSISEPLDELPSEEHDARRSKDRRQDLLDS